MKKILFASTALVAAGLMTTGTASASDKVKLELGGFSKWWVVGVWNKDDYRNHGPADAHFNNADVKGDNEIHFKGSTTLDNGLKVGVQVELEAGGHAETAAGQTTTGDVIDASFAWVEGGFGKVIVGTANNGTYLLHVNAPDAAGNWNDAGIMTTGMAVARPANVWGINQVGAAPSGTHSFNSTAIAWDNKSEKITYVAPSFAGLTVGASYIPNALREDSRGTPNNGVEVFGAGALYTNTFGGVGVKVSGGYARGNESGALNHVYNVAQAYTAGTQLSYAGFTVGGSYHKEIQNLKGSDTQTNPTADYGGNAYDLGIQYATGPYAVSFAYFKSEVEHTLAQAGMDKMEFYQVSAKYTMGPGVDLLASAGHAKFESEFAEAAGGDANHNEGWTVMTGLSLAF